MRHGEEDKGMRPFMIILGLMMMGTVSGCSTGAYNGVVAEEWGTAYKLSVANQILNPDAEKNLKPVTGMDNKSSDNIMTKYQKEFEKAPQVPVYNMQLPGALGSSSTSGARY